MLLGWTFALASGIANACVLAEPTALHASGPDGSQRHVADEVAAAHAAGHRAGGPSDDAPHTPCKKFCDDGNAGIAKYSPASSDGVLDAPLALVSWPVADSPRAEDVALVASGEPPRDGDAIPIRYLRLTL